MIWLHLRQRSLAFGSLLAAISIGAHVALRGKGWRYEWFWALHQYSFGVIFVGPIAAAVGAYEGSRWSSLSPSSAVRGGRWRLAGRISAVTSIAVALPVLLGLVAVVIASKGVGNPGGPVVGDLMLLAAAGAFTVGCATVGACLGLASGSSLAAPLLGLGVFVFSIVGYGMPGHLTDFGRATGSLVGASIVPAIPVTQVALWSAVAVAALAIVAIRRAPVGSGATLGAAAAVVVIAFVAQVGIDDRFEHDPDAVRCEREPALGIEVCLGRGYEQFRGDVRASVRPALGALRGAGVDTAMSFTQDASLIGLIDHAGFVQRGMLEGDPVDGGGAVLNALVPASCDLFYDAEALAAVERLGAALSSPGHQADVGVHVETLSRCRTVLD